MLKRTAAKLHKLTGGAFYQLNRYERARHHFERAIELVGDDFAAYVYLGRLAYKMGDYAGWHRECSHARRTSPERYSRLKHPFELFEPRAAGTLFDEDAERANWRTFKVSTVGTSAGGMPAESDSPCPSGPVRRFGDDFISDHEREKFRGLGPIDSTEVDGVDLDDLARRLCV